MVTDRQRKLVAMLVRLGLFRIKWGLWQPQVCAVTGMLWLLKRILRAQIVDDLHHAPACPANHFHRTRLVFSHCTCGAATAEREVLA